MRTRPMKKEFKVGNHARWNSEAGHVRAASKKEPQSLIKSDTIDHLAMHKGSALKKVSRNTMNDNPLLELEASSQVSDRLSLASETT